MRVTVRVTWGSSHGRQKVAGAVYRLDGLGSGLGFGLGLVRVRLGLGLGLGLALG